MLCMLDADEISEKLKKDKKYFSTCQSYLDEDENFMYTKKYTATFDEPAVFLGAISIVGVLSMIVSLAVVYFTFSDK